MITLIDVADSEWWVRNTIKVHINDNVLWNIRMCVWNNVKSMVGNISMPDIETAVERNVRSKSFTSGQLSDAFSIVSGI